MPNNSLPLIDVFRVKCEISEYGCCLLVVHPLNVYRARLSLGFNRAGAVSVFVYLFDDNVNHNRLL